MIKRVKPILFVTISLICACSNPNSKPYSNYDSELHYTKMKMLSSLDNENTKVYFRNDYETEVKSNSISEILNINNQDKPDSFWIVNNNQPFSDRYSPRDEPDIYHSSKQTIKVHNPWPLRPINYSSEGNFSLCFENSNIEFYVKMNMATNQILEIEYLPGVNVSIKYFFNETTGNLSTVNCERWIENDVYADEHAPHEVIRNGYDFSMKANVNDEEDKNYMQTFGEKLKKVVLNLWYLHKKYPTVVIKLNLNEQRLSYKIDSLMMYYKNSKILNDKGIPVWKSFENTTVQIVVEGGYIGYENMLFDIRMINPYNQKLQESIQAPNIFNILQKELQINRPTFRNININMHGDGGLLSILLKSGKVIKISHLNYPTKRNH